MLGLPFLLLLLLSHTAFAVVAICFAQQKLILSLVALQRRLAIQERTVKPSKEKANINDTDRWFFGWVHKRFTGKVPDSFFPPVKPERLVIWGKKYQTRLWLQRCLKRKPKPNKPGRPSIPDEHIAFIQRIHRENPDWSSKKIAYELELKCGVLHWPSTIDKYKKTKKRFAGPSKDNGQKWRTFVDNHLSVTFACDFVTQFVGLGRRYYIFAVMHLETRRIVHWNVTMHPTLPWVQQQIREATADFVPRFLIHDNDGIFGQFTHRHRPKRKKGRKTYRCSLDRWLDQVMDIQGLPIPFAAPNANAFSERFNRTLREEAFDHFVFFNEYHLRWALRNYIEYYNRARPHQGIRGIPNPYDEIATPPPDDGKLVSIPVLGGLHNDYRRAA